MSYSDGMIFIPVMPSSLHDIVALGMDRRFQSRLKNKGSRDIEFATFESFAFKEHSHGLGILKSLASIFQIRRL